MSFVYFELRRTVAVLLRSPIFSLIAVLSMALGIGTATGIFALTNGILLRSLPVPRAHELRAISWIGGGGNFHSFSGTLKRDEQHSEGNAVSLEMFQAIRDATADSAQVFAFLPLLGITARAGGEPLVMDGLMVSSAFFSALEIQPKLGRTFGTEDGSGGAAGTVVLSHGLWKRQFDGDPAAVGRSLSLNGRPYTVIGVLPGAFQGLNPGAREAFYVTLSSQQTLLPRYQAASPDHWWLQLMARVKRGREGAFQAALDLAFRRRIQNPREQPRMVIQDGRLGSGSGRQQHREALVLMLGGAGLLLLAACANLSGLALTRGASRYHEDSVRAALGATHSDLMRPVLLEGMVLALTGGGLGLFVALGVRNGLSRLLAGTPDGLGYDLALSPAVLGFSLAATVASGLLSGLLPAVRAARTAPLGGLREHASHGARRPALGRILIVAQLGFSLALLSGAGLLLRSMHGLLTIDPGFDTRNLLLVSVDPGNAGHPPQANFHEQVLDGLRALPGVDGAGLSEAPFLSGSSVATSFELPGRGETPVGQRNTLVVQVNETFFPTLGVPLKVGRGFRRSDDQGAPKVVVVNEALVRAFLPDQNPLGQTLRMGTEEDWQIIGVCPDLRHVNIRNPPEPTAFFSYRQDPTGSACYALRTRTPTAVLLPLVRKVIASVDPTVPIARVSTQEDLRDREIRHERLLATLSVFMAGFSLLLACIGLYGLMAFSVNRRMGEFGIRMALGAGPRSIQWLVLREALAMAAAGALLGLGCSVALTRILKSFLYGVKPADPAIFAGVVLVLILVALVAALLPTRRAARSDPAETLRAQ
jgi:predicted permease